MSAETLEPEPTTMQMLQMIADLKRKFGAAGVVIRIYLAEGISVEYADEPKQGAGLEENDEQF